MREPRALMPLSVRSAMDLMGRQEPAWGPSSHSGCAHPTAWVYLGVVLSGSVWRAACAPRPPLTAGGGARHDREREGLRAGGEPGPS